MTHYLVTHAASLHVHADDPEEAQIIARNALENARESAAVTGLFCDPRYTTIVPIEEDE